MWKKKQLKAKSQLSCLNGYVTYIYNRQQADFGNMYKKLLDITKQQPN